MSRDRDVWEFAVFDLEFARRGASELRYVLHYDDAGDVDGFATYRFKENFDDEPRGRGADQGGLGRGARGVRQHLALPARPRPRPDASTDWIAPLDEPLRHLVADARAVETSLTDNLYLRVVDVEAALAAASTPPASTW